MQFALFDEHRNLITKTTKIGDNQSPIESNLLPNGETWTACLDAHKKVWSTWRRLTRYALSHGEGVQVYRGLNKVIIRSVCSSGAGFSLEVYPDNTITYDHYQDVLGGECPEDSSLPWKE